MGGCLFYHVIPKAIAQINGLWEKQQIWPRYSQKGFEFEIQKINEHLSNRQS